MDFMTYKMMRYLRRSLWGILSFLAGASCAVVVALLVVVAALVAAEMVVNAVAVCIGEVLGVLGDVSCGWERALRKILGHSRRSCPVCAGSNSRAEDGTDCVVECSGCHVTYYYDEIVGRTVATGGSE